MFSTASSKSTSPIIVLRWSRFRTNCGRHLRGLHHESQVPLYSTVTGSRSDGIGWDAGYWLKNVRQPVLFAAALDEMISAGHHVFLEIGAHPVLATSMIDGLRNRNRSGLVLASLHRQKPERPAFSTRSERCTSRAIRLTGDGFTPGVGGKSNCQVTLGSAKDIGVNRSSLRERSTGKWRTSVARSAVEEP